MLLDELRQIVRRYRIRDGAAQLFHKLVYRALALVIDFERFVERALSKSSSGVPNPFDHAYTPRLLQPSKGRENFDDVFHSTRGFSIFVRDRASQKEKVVGLILHLEGPRKLADQMIR